MIIAMVLQINPKKLLIINNGNTTGTHTTVKLLWFVKKNKNIEIGHKKKKLKLVKL